MIRRGGEKVSSARELRQMGRTIVVAVSLLLLYAVNFASMDPTASGPDHLLIVQVYYDTYLPFEPETFLAIYNPTATTIDLSNYQISDLESTMQFPAGASIASNQTLFITKNATAFYQEFLRRADYETDDTDPSVPEMIGGFPVLANENGDEVILKDSADNMIDVVVYEPSTYKVGWVGVPHIDVSEGVVLLRAKEESSGEYLDTDSVADWSYGKYAPGYASHYRKLVAGQAIWNHTELRHTGRITAFVSPDSGYSEIARAIDTATSSIYITSYTFENYYLAENLSAAASKGVDVRIWLEGDSHNFSGVSDQTLYLCRMLEDSGGKVYFSTQNASLDIHDRYDAIHSKVGIVDGRNVWVMSENLGMTGLPVNNTTGNRGWGVIVWNNTDLAQYFTDVFLEDTNTGFKDVTRYGTDPEYTAPSSGGPDQSIPTGYYEPKFPSRTVEVSSSRIEPVLGPDTTRMRTRSVLGMLDSATNSIYINFFYLYKHWGVPKNDYTPQTAPNHYLEAAIEAARRGVQVRILLDDTWYNVEAGDPVDNDDTVDYVNQIASSEGLDMEARLVDSSMLNLTKTHNKGMIVDHHLTLVGSVNGNYASTTNNREAALILDNPDVAMYFESVFFNDWDYSYVPGIPDPPSKVNAELYGSAHEHVNISWSLSLDDPSVGSGENDVANYAIYYSNNYDRGGIGYRFLTSLPPGTSYYLHPFAGDGDPNNYFYYVQANDTLGYVAKSPMQVAKFTRLLSSGTQLISIPLVLSNRTVQDALKTLHYDAVWSYSGKDRKWSYFMTFKPSNGFTEVDEKTGFWVHVLTPDYLTVAGRVPMSTKVNLYQSWNLLGYPSFLSRTAGEVFIPLSCDIVESYEESTPPYFLRKMASSDSVGPGNAYWIQCSSNTVWTVEN